MSVKREAKKAGKKAAELWVAKKGIQWAGSLIKISVVAGVGYLVYTYIRDHQDEIKEKLS